ncbi:alpha/beta hydrolase family protein [Sphingobacterium yanglingense]|uniref:Prolyl oligopeptidase family protein n=1 Tax=Sphingobacterium yanglingense TaxID=1437280 RepID=A0A4R6WIQ7_9SPHI|nr:prolyl oligopeptidase family serine peptidase [Sphingobacterium yanglingense]TDQ80123.1 prolyl oligopeptidase family protein [Sphingobacterium yanglingense]
MRYTILCACLGWGIAATAQTKKPLTHQDYDLWRSIQAEAITDDGLWFSYEIKDKKDFQQLYIGNEKTVDSISNGSALQFSVDSKYALFQKASDDKKKRDFYLRSLTTGQIELIPAVQTVTFLNGNTPFLLQKVYKESLDSVAVKKKWLPTTKLVLTTMSQGDSLVIPSLIKHRYSPDYNHVLYLQRQDSIRILSLMDLKTKRAHVLAKGNINYSLANFGGKSDRLVYIQESVNGKDTINSLYVVSTYTGKLLDSVTRATAGIAPGFQLSPMEQLSLSADGGRVYFKAKRVQPIDTATVKKKVQLDIWKWDADAIPPMNKGGKMVESDFYQYTLGSKRAVQLTDSSMPFLQFPEGSFEDVTIGFSDIPYRHLVGITADRQYDSYLVNLKTGERQLILKGKFGTPRVSYDKRFVSWYESTDSSWHAMDTKTLQDINLTKQIPAVFYNDDLDKPMHSTHYTDLGWTDSGHDFLVHSKYDVWQIDPTGKRAPINLTKGLGAQKGIVFRYVKSSKSERYVATGKPMYFTALDEVDKKDGYFVRTQDGQFKELAMSNHVYAGLTLAKEGEHLLWRKGDFINYPELYYSKTDFSEVKKLTVTNPQQSKYIWGTSELVEWESFNKDALQGILCKPENFDPNKKYPMVVYFYETRSDLVNRYNVPAAIKSVVNWSYMVSNGYLVFIPDVKFRVGEPGESSYDAIVSGVHALMMKHDYIDKDRIGLNGHSWGGYQTAYLLTKTNLFKAAVAGAVVSNMTSAYGGIRWESGQSRMSQYEHGQSRIGTDLWSNPALYIDNSPIFGLKNVQTPVLMMHNDQDGAVPWEQGIELFMGMRRLGKPAWMLNYKGEGHLLNKEENKDDFTVKVTDFFDHYLKDKPKPSWM